MMAEGANTKTTALRERLHADRPRPLAKIASARYSRFVDAMKMVLPAIAAALILTVVAWPELHKTPSTFKIGAVNITLDDVEHIRMVSPRFQGRDKHGDPFTVTANYATKNNPSSDVVELDGPVADVTQAKGSWIQVKADYGAYQETAQLLDLIGKVSLYRDDGFEFHTLSAHVNLANNSAEGDDPVRGHGPSGEVTAQGFRVYNKGDQVIFTGKARLLLRPGAKDALHE